MLHGGLHSRERVERAAKTARDGHRDDTGAAYAHQWEIARPAPADVPHAEQITCYLVEKSSSTNGTIVEFLNLTANGTFRNETVQAQSSTRVYQCTQILPCTERCTQRYRHLGKHAGKLNSWPFYQLAEKKHKRTRRQLIRMTEAYGHICDPTGRPCRGVRAQSALINLSPDIQQKTYGLILPLHSLCRRACQQHKECQQPCEFMPGHNGYHSCLAGRKDTPGRHSFEKKYSSKTVRLSVSFYESAKLHQHEVKMSIIAPLLISELIEWHYTSQQTEYRKKGSVVLSWSEYYRDWMPDEPATNYLPGSLVESIKGYNRSPDFLSTQDQSILHFEIRPPRDEGMSRAVTLRGGRNFDVGGADGVLLRNGVPDFSSGFYVCCAKHELCPQLRNSIFWDIGGNG